MENTQQAEMKNNNLKAKEKIADEKFWEREADFLKHVYYPQIELSHVTHKDFSVNDKGAIVSIAHQLEHLGDQTDRFKSIIEDSEPTKEDDMPILHYKNFSEYIVNGFDANEQMTTIEVFTDKWERYTKERGSKETNKDWLKEEYFYRSNRMPEILTSKFKVVQNSIGEKRVKAYLTIFIPRKKIECQIENQRYTKKEEVEISLDNLIIFGLLSPLWPGNVPDVRFYTNHLRSSKGFEYSTKTIEQPLYIKDFAKVEYYMKTILRDIYKYGPNDLINFSEDSFMVAEDKEEIQKGLPKFKNYFFVPVKINAIVDHPEDIIDWNYIDRIQDIHDKGIFNKFPSLHEIFTNHFNRDTKMLQEYMEDNIFIKGNKPHCLYVNFEYIEDLRKKDAQEFAEQLKINIGGKQFASSYDLIDSGKINASTLRHFKEYSSNWDGLGYGTYMTNPVVVGDFIKNPDTLKLRFLPVDLAIKNKRKLYTEAKPPGVSGRPIMSMYDIYPYFMNKEQWLHCWFLQILSTHFERCSYVTELVKSVGLHVNWVDLYFATNSKATSSEMNLEPFETYGDTVLKFAASWISYNTFKNDPEAGENEICERRNWFVTNKELFRVGISLNLRRYIRTLDGDISSWVPPFTKLTTKIKENRNYFVETKFTGKNMADCTEALIAAYMFSGGVKHALKFISKIGAVPLDKWGLLDKFPDDPFTIDCGDPSEFKARIDSNFEEIFREYCKRHEPNKIIIKNFKKRLNIEQWEPMGIAYKHMGSK